MHNHTQLELFPELQQTDYSKFANINISAVPVFMAAAGQPFNSIQTLELYHNHVTREELKEYRDWYAVLDYHLQLLEASNDYHVVPLAVIIQFLDGCIDSLWTIASECYALGVSPVPLFNEVARSNLSKIPESGTIEKNAAGKVMKPAGYIKPNLIQYVVDSPVIQRLTKLNAEELQELADLEIARNTGGTTNEQ